MRKNDKPVIIWLLSGCILVFVMVVVGGITRLKNAGLSMTDWHLLTDMIPPLTQEKWQKAYEEYQKFPEYQKINKFDNFSLDDYKFIYFWEWFHRLIGRIIGLVFLIPFGYFILKKRFDRSTLLKCIILLGMGALQGFLGWFMVKSGLISDPDVSHFRLAIHLTFAFLTFAFTLWIALDLIYKNQRQPKFPTIRRLLVITFVVLIIQIIYGGFVAGLNAGLVHNSWPLMSEGKVIHSTVFTEKPTLFQNLVEGRSGVNFVHRTFAYVVVGMIVFVFFRSRKYVLSKQQRSGIQAMLVLVFTQFTLGVLTLLNFVPMSLGLLHQATAFLLLAAVTYTLHRFSK